MRDGWNPPSPAFSARFPTSVDGVVMVYYGLQYRGERLPGAHHAARDLRERIAATDGPSHHDLAVVVDPGAGRRPVGFEYLGCHERTGLLNAQEAPSRV